MITNFTSHFYLKAENFIWSLFCTFSKICDYWDILGFPQVDSRIPSSFSIRLHLRSKDREWDERARGQGPGAMKEVLVVVASRYLVLSHLLWTLAALTLQCIQCWGFLSHVRERAASRKIPRFWQEQLIEL